VCFGWMEGGVKERGEQAIEESYAHVRGHSHHYNNTHTHIHRPEALATHHSHPCPRASLRYLDPGADGEYVCVCVCMYVCISMGWRSIS
jgi:hypothetical protein